MVWRNSVVNREVDLGACPFEAYFCRKPTFSYDQLAIKDVAQVNPNDFANLCAAMDVCVRTAAAVASSQVTAQYDRERSPPPAYRPGDYVLAYFPDRESKCPTYYHCPFQILAADDAAGNYYSVIDCIQKKEYVVHVERIKPFDMSRTSLEEQAAYQLPSRASRLPTTFARLWHCGRLRRTPHE